jgi:hypothetical protein
MNGYKFGGVLASTAVQTENLLWWTPIFTGHVGTLNKVEVRKEEIFNWFVMNGLPHDKICTDHFYIKDYLLNFSTYGNLLQGIRNKWTAVWISVFVSVCNNITYKDMTHHPVLSDVPTNITK